MALYYLHQYVTTTLNKVGGLDTSETTGIVLFSVDNIDITKPGIALLSYEDPLDLTKSEWITYTSINASNELQGVTRGGEGESAKTHVNGCAIAFPLSKSHINNLNDFANTPGSGAEINTGTDNAKFVTSKAIKDANILTQAWAAYTPSLTGITIGNGTLAGRYTRLGKTIIGSIYFKMGSTSAVTGYNGFSLPVTARAYAGTVYEIIGHGEAYDAAPGTYDCWVRMIDANTCGLQVVGTGGTYATRVDFSSTVPFTWAVNDEMTLWFMYEAA